ncbi:MAG: Ig-like domain-containing protein [bacterium]|nr:Ig-like domain-containing protein [bacterium]
MKNPKFNTLVLIVFLAFIAGSLFSLRLFGIQQTNKEAVLPTSTPIKELTVLKNFPSPGPHQTSIPGEAILFTFDQKIDPQTISFDVSPKITLKWNLDPGQSTLSLYPTSVPWEENKEYTITISKKLSSVGGNKLKEDLIYNYQYEFSKTQQ